MVPAVTGPRPFASRSRSRSPLASDTGIMMRPAGPGRPPGPGQDPYPRPHYWFNLPVNKTGDKATHIVTQPEAPSHGRTHRHGHGDWHWQAATAAAAAAGCTTEGKKGGGSARFLSKETLVLRGLRERERVRCSPQLGEVSFPVYYRAGGGNGAERRFARWHTRVITSLRG